MEHIIDAENLHKTYPGNQTKAVEGVSLKIRKGEFYGLLGANGAGKTTVLGGLCGILPFDAGRITIDGAPLDKNREEIKIKIGVVPQDLALYPSLNAYENLRFVGMMYEIPAKELKKRIGHYIKIFGLSQVAHRRIATYSGGMKRKVNLIAGIIHQPQIVFLDEPTVGIDIQSRKIIIDFLLDLHQRGITIIYTSHNMEEAEMLCTRIGILNLGKMVMEGPPKELMANNPKHHRLENLLLRFAQEGEIIPDSE